MKKFLLIFIILFGFTTVSFAENGDILYVKFMYSPVISSIDESAKVITILQKWYVVLDLWNNGEYTHIMLTDGKKWYMLTQQLGNYTFNNYQVNGNKGSISSKTTLYSGPNYSSRVLGQLPENTDFYILHVNYINSKFLKIKILSGTHKNKTWYIESNNINISHVSNYKNEIEKFIEKYAKNKNWELVYMNNDNSTEYTPLFEEKNENDIVSIFQKQNTNNNSKNISYTDTSSISNNDNEIKDNWFDFSRLFLTESNTGNTQTSPQLNEKKTPSYTSGGSSSSSSNNSSSNSGNSKNNSSEPKSPAPNELGLGTKNNMKENDITDFLNLLNQGLSTNEISSNSGTNNNNDNNDNSVIDFLNLLNQGLSLEDEKDTTTQEQIDIENFFNLLLPNESTIK